MINKLLSSISSYSVASGHILFWNRSLEISHTLSNVWATDDKEQKIYMEVSINNFKIWKKWDGIFLMGFFYFELITSNLSTLG